MLRSLKENFLLLFLPLIFIQSGNFDSGNPSKQLKSDPPQQEIIYHVFLRSFYDSNGDQQGDLKGLKLQLDYLQQLGVTAILLTPLYKSVFYHNYFATDFEQIDDEYGTMQDYLDLVKEIHKRGMKIYMDMETQYVTEDHLWFKDSYGNPKSSYSDYLLYTDSLNTKTEPMMFGLTQLGGYDGTIRKVALVNLYSKNVQDYNYKLFKHFMDPNGDRKFDDGVDGFRLDHMMDDLDWKGKLTDLFSRFWNPLLTSLRKVNPKIIFIAEQADWNSYGVEYFEKGGVDRVFAFHLQQAIASFNKEKLMRVADSTFSLTPAGKQQIVFLENHDMQRFGSTVHENLSKLKIGGTLNLLIGGVPSIYYGQELGMQGVGGFAKFGNTDANDIPRREAFEWYKADSGAGMALWYKNSGPWWDRTNLKPNDGISVEEEKNDPNSLLNFYKTIIQLRKVHPVLYDGTYQSLKNDNDQVFSFLRYEKDHAAIVVINLSELRQQVTINFSGSATSINGKQPRILYGNVQAQVQANTLSASLPQFAILVLEISI